MNARMRPGKAHLRSDAQAGFTLIEMVIAIVVLTMIIGAISAAFVSSMNSTSASKQRVDASNDAQLISGFLTRDAQAAGGTDPQTGSADPTLGVWADAFAPGCNTTPPGTPILGLKWTDLASGTTYEANYSYIATATGTYQPQQLLRTICSATSDTPPATDVGISVLANNVVTTDTGTMFAPKAWCDNNRPPAAPACATRFPNTVSMGVSVNNAGQNLTPPFSFLLTASLRPQSDSQPDLGSGATTASLLLLGGGTCLRDASSAFHLTIYGSAALNACTANLHQTSDVTPFGALYVSKPGTCTGLPAPCIVVNSSSFDPFKQRIIDGALAPPTGNCSGPQPTLGSDHNWHPGTYPRDPQDPSLGGSVHPFAAGQYIFCNGLSGDVKANLGGTFFYFSGGSYTCEPDPVGPNCNSRVEITPPESGMYQGLALWQVEQDPAITPPIVFSKGFVNIAGTVYAPSALVNMKNGDVNINQLIAWAIDGTPGNPQVHIGPPLRVTLADPLPPGAQNQTYSGAQAVAVDGTGVYNRWTIAGIAGLRISLSGVITGTPDASVTPGVHTVTVGVRDTDDESASVTVSITVYPALTIGGTLPNWTVNKPGYPANPLTAGGGSGTGYAWTASNMPTGLQMDASGAISGTPTTTGTYSPTITLTDSIGDSTTIHPTVVIFVPPTITKVQLVNGSGNTAGRIEKGDQIVITFSAAMNPASFCTGWNGNQRKTNNVKVTLNDGGASNDSISVADSSCSGGFNFGALTLGSAAYTAAPITFGTNGNPNNSSITLSGTTLTIVLGTGGPSTTVLGPTTASYAPSAAVTDTGGVAIDTTAVTTSNIVQF